jgi:L-ascorbate metabolism protein UlaG (beta-lactamase superfamily)
LLPKPASLGSVVRAAVALVFGAGCAASYAGPPSAHFDGARFHNDPEVRELTAVDVVHWWASAKPTPWPDWVDWAPGSGPSRPPAIVDDDHVRVTWVNHSTALIQMSGVNILTDPVWSARVGPTSWLGPARHHAPGVRFEDLPRIDAVLISHDHYDHMDLPTLERLAARDGPRVISGLGNGRLLDRALIRPHQELDWWDCRSIGRVRVCAVPAQHNSRRGIADGARTLWVGFWVESSAGSVFFAGDTGFGPHFAAIRARMGAPCVALLPIGAYLPRWFMKDIHMSPADAVRAEDVLGPRLAIAVHFATFQQSDEGMWEPAGELGLALAKTPAVRAPFVVPDFGEARDVTCRDR